MMPCINFDALWEDFDTTLSVIAESYPQEALELQLRFRDLYDRLSYEIPRHDLSSLPEFEGFRRDVVSLIQKWQAKVP